MRLSADAAALPLACASADAEYPERITYVIGADGIIEWAEKVGDIEAHIHAALARLSDA